MVLQSFLADRLPTSLFRTIPEELHVPMALGVLVLVPVAAWALTSTFTSEKTAVKLPVQLPGALPILGNLLDVLRNKNDRHNWITSLCEKYGGRPIQFTMLGRPPVTILYTAEGAEDILKTHFDSIPKGPVQTGIIRDVLGHGIFAVDGPQWVHQRKTASNLFTARALRDTMTESMRRYTIVLQRILQKACDDGSAIDMFKLMNAFTIEAFAKMGFGIDINCLEADVDHPFQSAFDSSQRVLVGRAQRPAWFWKLQRLLNIGAEAQLKQDIAVIDKTVMGIIAESLARRGEAKDPSQKAPTSADIVSLFLDRFDGYDGEAFDPVYLRDIVVNFLIAGRDTTAQAMSWCYYNLSNHPEVVAKIRAEMAELLPDFASGRDTSPPTMEQVQQLVYLDVTLKETLRLHPSVPSIPKSVAEDVVLSDGTLLRKGGLVVVSTYAMARMKFVWGDDAKDFKPERWIDPDTGKLLNVSSFKFATFNAGPRICLGMNLAMLEMKIVMASVLNRFDVKLVDAESVTYDNSLTLPVKGAMMAHIVARK